MTARHAKRINDLAALPEFDLQLYADSLEQTIKRWQKETGELMSELAAARAVARKRKRNASEKTHV